MRVMGGAVLAVDLDLMCDPDKGEAVRGRYGRLEGIDHDGELGDTGGGSVDRRRVGGFRTPS